MPRINLGNHSVVVFAKGADGEDISVDDQKAIEDAVGREPNGVGHRYDTDFEEEADYYPACNLIFDSITEAEAEAIFGIISELPIASRLTVDRVSHGRYVRLADPDAPVPEGV